MEELTKEELWPREPYCTIVNNLREGKPFAVTANDLSRKTGLSDRALRKCLEDLRESGECIISDATGYYYPATETELERYIRRTEKTARSYFYSLRTAKRELRRMKESSQMKIEE